MILFTDRLMPSQEHSAPPPLQMLLHTLLILPINFSPTRSRNNTAGHFPGHLPLRATPVESLEYTPAFEHHRAFVFGESKLEELVEIAFTERRLKELVQHDTGKASCEGIKGKANFRKFFGMLAQM